MKFILNVIVYSVLINLAGFAVLFAQADKRESLDISASFGNEVFSGFTQYELDIPVFSEDGTVQLGTGHSRLKFPYSSYMTGGYVNLEYYGFQLNVGFWGQYRSQVDKYFEDFDWLTSADEDQRLAYGRAEPDPELDYWEIEFSYNFRLASLNLRPILAYQRLNAEFYAKNLEQTWYVDLNDGTIFDPPRQSSVPGNVLYYEQNLDLPYLAFGIGYEAFKDRLNLELVLGGTFLASVEDYDDHIIRSDSLEAWNSGDGGTGVLGGLNIDLNVFEAFWAGIDLSYQDYTIDTDGLQRYRDDDNQVVLANTDTEVRGVIRAVRVTISYFF